MWLHRVAGNSFQCGCSSSFNHRLGSPNRRLHHNRRTRVLGWPFLGQNTLLRRLHRQILLRHRRLRLRQARVLRKRRRASCHPRRVHPRRSRRPRLLRREFSRRLQRADAGGAAGWLRREVHRDGVRGRSERRVSFGA